VRPSLAPCLDVDRDERGVVAIGCRMPSHTEVVPGKLSGSSIKRTYDPGRLSPILVVGDERTDYASALITEVLAGDTRATNRFIVEHPRRAYKFVLPRAGGDQGVAEDLCQLVMGRAMRLLYTYRGGAALATAVRRSNWTGRDSGSPQLSRRTLPPDRRFRSAMLRCCCGGARTCEKRNARSSDFSLSPMS
jgi:hypothetical protein